MAFRSRKTLETTKPPCTTVMSIRASSLASRRFASSPSAWASRKAPARISWSSRKYRFDGLPQRGLGDGRFGSKSAHPATFEAVAGNVEITEDPIQSRTVRSYGLARELAHFIGHLTEGHGREVHLSLEMVIEAALPRPTFC